MEKDFIRIFMDLLSKCQQPKTKITTTKYISDFVTNFKTYGFGEELTEEWIFWFLAFQIQNDLSIQVYYKTTRSLYLSNFLTKKGVAKYLKKNEYWRSFIKRDLFDIYGFGPSDILSEEAQMKGKKKSKEGFEGISSNLDKDSLVEELEVERGKFFNTEEGFGNCLVNEVPFSVDSEFCPKCTYKDICQKT